ncbi:hypothetical protein [Massilia orientalis]|uniref:Uncharacterized protein n=1 Tax=Massilia orientalis TaxID=3050128 RepID=A0ACC7MDS3_9BURK|nr:hypothetical protein [Massilia sp. YIM B02787]
MTEFNRYWAEDALGESYAPQDYRWMKSSRRAGMLLGGVTCVLTTGALLGAAVYHLVDPAPRVSISSYEIELASTQPPAPAPSPPKATPESNKELGRRVPADPPQLASTATGKPDLSRGAAAAPAIVAAKVDHTTKAPAAGAGIVPAAPQAKAPLTATTPAPGPVAGSAPAVADRNALAPSVPDKRQPAKPPDASPSAKPEADTRIGLSKAAESKPTDIASGEKLGIREVLPDGIIMQNGRRIKNGSSLPNGEILMGTDATKGMVETDRRVLVLTP